MVLELRPHRRCQMSLLAIASTILPPVLILIGIGVLVDRWWRMDLTTLSKIVFAIFVPALVFEKVLISPLDWSQMGSIGLFALLHVLCMGLCSRRCGGSSAG